MRTHRSAIATRVSWFCAVLAIAACDDTIKHTSLDGDVTCGGRTCATGTLCVTGPQHVDAALLVPTEVHCNFVPQECQVYDCTGGECPMCIREMCDDDFPVTSLMLRGRQLMCPLE